MIRNSQLDRLLLDNLSTAVMLLDDSLCLEYMNPAAENLLELSYRRTLKVFIGDTLLFSPEALQALSQAVTQFHSFTCREAHLLTAGRQQITADYSVTPLSIHGHTQLLLEVFPKDRLIKISREEAQHAKQETSRQLVRGLAHEIKNPLGGIRGAAQLLGRELTDSTLQDYTQIIINEADRLRNLVDRMLGSNRSPQLITMNIHEVLERIRCLIEAETMGQIKLTRDYDPSIPDLEIDREQMIQAFLNIIRNAMQALTGQDNPGITLRTRTLRQYTLLQRRHRLVIKVDIIDNGPGIPKALQETIFYPMVSGKADGTGLGLAITQNIISQHQGLVEFESIPGNTVFSIFLPLHQETPDK